jgi:hypothetical protein
MHTEKGIMLGGLDVSHSKADMATGLYRVTIKEIDTFNNIYMGFYYMSFKFV